MFLSSHILYSIFSIVFFSDDLSPQESHAHQSKPNLPSTIHASRPASSTSSRAASVVSTDRKKHHVIAASLMNGGRPSSHSHLTHGAEQKKLTLAGLAAGKRTTIDEVTSAACVIL